ncbi:Dipeptidyl-peptidase 5 [Smittium culicis]|uniref:Dipeptidyl-peptidase V n=1 Tax=Smittium culicis TaxID=133412 RepID=A0A1R1XN66_9FUNG|nr:Dipeptidyl-peptidase 5 [Smittium culicis]
MKFCSLLVLPSLAIVTFADVFNPDPSQFPDWSKVGRFDPEIFVQLKRMSSPAVSPNNKFVVYSQYKYNTTLNSKGTNLRLVDLTKGFSSAIDLTEFAYGQGDSSPVWIDDNTVAFTAVRGSPASNIFTVSTVDKSIKQLTNYTNDIGGIVYSKDAGSIAFTSMVYQGMDLEQSAVERQRISDLPSSGVVHNKLFVRHWDTWILQDRSQLFTIPVSNSYGSVSVTGKPVNICAKYSGAWGLEPDFYQFSPDGKRILFNAKIQGKEESWQTENGIFEAPVDGSAEPKRLNSNFKGASSSPVYSPDGSKIAWLQMATRGYESDQNQVILYDIKTATQKRVISSWDRSPSSIHFSNDSTKLYLEVSYEKDVAIFEVDLAADKFTRLTADGTYSFVSQLSESSFLVTKNSMQFPTRLYTMNKSQDGTYTESQVTFEDNDLLNSLWFSKAESFWFVGALNENVQGMILYPYGFDPACKYPVMYLIHGGPQSSWNDGWSSRWNPNIYANQGFVTVIVNFHGGDAYGQAFTDSIAHNWGSYPFQDLMTGLDVVIHNAKFVDEDNIVAAGASYGGYMINWINGHTDRFKALINHDGVFNTVGMYYMTEELWFMEHDMGIPWVAADREIYDKYNPEKFTANWKTPTFIIHSELDFRIPVSEGLSAFTVLQRKGIDSKYLYFPDENHWILKPQNTLKWLSEKLQWAGKYTNTTVWQLQE